MSWQPVPGTLLPESRFGAGCSGVPYLALHPMGFSVPPRLRLERWALTPPFHPCQTLRAFRRRLAGFPARCHRAALRRRSILCGTFRSAPGGTGFGLCSPLRPLALPGALPCQEFRSSQRVKSVPQDGVRTFLPPGHLAMTKPAITRPARHF